MEEIDNRMMYSVNDFQGSFIEDMSILYSPSFNHPDGKLGNDQNGMELNHEHYHQHMPLDNSGLLRYRSVPSSFLESHVNNTGSHGGGGGGGGSGRTVGGADYCYFGSLNPGADTTMLRFMPTYNGTGNPNSHNLREFEERPVVKQEAVDSEMAYQNFSGHDMANGNSLGSRFNVMNALALDNSTESNLIRQNSSQAETFSTCFDDGFGAMRDFGSLKAGRETNVETGHSTSMLSQVNFASSPRLFPRISEIGCESLDAGSPDGRISKRQFLPCFANDSWDDTSLDGVKAAHPDRSVLSGLRTLDYQNRNPGNPVIGLTHHLSLPKGAAEVATMDKFLHFQGATPCKFRAKRGYATNPRSIAERVRRTRISERMRKLQDLFPNMDKQTNTADMLDLAAEYIKDLQKQVKILKDIKAKCTCPNKKPQYPSLA